MPYSFLNTPVTQAAPVGRIPDMPPSRFIDGIAIKGSSLGALSTLKIELLVPNQHSVHDGEAISFLSRSTVLHLEEGDANKDAYYPVLQHAVDESGSRISGVTLPWCTHENMVFEITLGGTIPDDAGVMVHISHIDKYYLN